MKTINFLAFVALLAFLEQFALAASKDKFIDSIEAELGTSDSSGQARQPVKATAPGQEPVTGTIVRNGRKISNGYTIVKMGDTLSQIARDIYGDSIHYDRIYQANRRLLKNPHSVLAGLRLRIPLP